MEKKRTTLVVMLDGLRADGGGDAGFARAGTTDQHDVVGLVDEVAAMELAHERLIDLAGGKIEAVQVPVGRKAGDFELVSN